MLIHIVCWKYKPETDEAAREDHRDRLKALVGVIPEIVTFDVGADVLHLDRSFDTGLVATFPDRVALDAYTDHPEHQAVAAFGRQLAEKAISVDFYRDN
ncbi:MAG: Dabb family protein [Pyrinomonadaceae bacterium]|nr:Dabb family protein [Pyrinomonadaceae bacterium]